MLEVEEKLVGKEESLTPRQIVAELDKYIIGQDQAKRSVAIAIRNRWRRLRLPEAFSKEVGPKNIMMIGPTGVGKTEIARRLAGLIKAPFVKVEATKYTEVGYHGRDVESMVRDLLELAIREVRDEYSQQLTEQVEHQVEERLLDCLLPSGDWDGHDEDRRQRTRQKLRQQLRAGGLEDRLIEVVVEEKAVPFGVVAPMGMEAIDPEFQNIFEKLLPSKSHTKRLPVRDARKIIHQQQLESMLDREKVISTAIKRTESTGIIFLDEIDKICGPDGKHGPDVSRQGVQRDLLPIVEGCAVVTRHGIVHTDHILFIAAGAFSRSKPSDLLPELQGRFPIRVELNDLSKDDFVRILTEPENALIKQQKSMLATEGVTLDFSEDGIDEIADIAFQVNQRAQNIGARRLYTIIEKVMERISFEGPELAGRKIVIDADYVRQQVADIAEDEDLSKFIL